MDKERMAELEKIEAHGAENGRVTPMTEEDKAYFAYFRSVFKRYNTQPNLIKRKTPSAWKACSATGH